MLLTLSSVFKLLTGILDNAFFAAQHNLFCKTEQNKQFLKKMRGRGHTAFYCSETD